MGDRTVWSRSDATLGDRTARTQWCPVGLWDEENQGDATLRDKMVRSWGDATLGTGLWGDATLGGQDDEEPG